MHILKSRKFWASLLALITIGASLAAGGIDPQTAVYSVVAIVVSYSGFTAWEDVARSAAWHIISNAAEDETE